MFLLRLVYIVNLLNSLLNGRVQVVHVDRLDGKIEGPVVHGLTNVRHVTICTHHDDAQRGFMHLVQLGQQCQTVHFGHVNI